MSEMRDPTPEERRAFMRAELEVQETAVCAATELGHAEWPCCLPEGHESDHDDWNGRRWRNVG